MGLTVENDAIGCLQDIHWYGGDFGYFPTYSIGAFIAAQLAQKIQREIQDYNIKLKNGDFKPLHVINPLRAKYIKDKTNLENKKVLDVGCGGGLLAEALHDFGAKVTGIDAAGPGIEVAKLHASNNKKDIEYFEKTAEDLNQEYQEYFDDASGAP